MWTEFVRAIGEIPSTFLTVIGTAVIAGTALFGTGLGKEVEQLTSPDPIAVSVATAPVLAQSGGGGSDISAERLTPRIGDAGMQVPIVYVSLGAMVLVVALTMGAIVVISGRSASSQETLSKSLNALSDAKQSLALVLNGIKEAQEESNHHHRKSTPKRTNQSDQT